MVPRHRILRFAHPWPPGRLPKSAGSCVNSKDFSANPNWSTFQLFSFSGERQRLAGPIIFTLPLDKRRQIADISHVGAKQADTAQVESDEADDLTKTPPR